MFYMFLHQNNPDIGKILWKLVTNYGSKKSKFNDSFVVNKLENNTEDYE